MGKKKSAAAPAVKPVTEEGAPSTTGRSASTAAAGQHAQQQHGHQKAKKDVRAAHATSAEAAVHVDGGEAAAGTAGAAAVKKRAKAEMDDIFASKKRKGNSSTSGAAEQEAGVHASTSAPGQLSSLPGKGKQPVPAAKAPRVEGNKDDIFGDAAGGGRKRTEEGYAIYSEEELGMGKQGGGDTDLCPFDCDCCF